MCKIVYNNYISILSLIYYKFCHGENGRLFNEISQESNRKIKDRV